ncbi:uncharacterized protein [Taeniopygia guttata]|uniref:uncharacterized protein isoform X1 n=1 Tax=Taeniopygia guttata TaxID=59729 RepID=UPI003BB94F6C
MEAPLWALLLLPLPPLLASLCACAARCRRARPPQRPPMDNYDCTPPLSAPPPARFMVVTPRCAPPPQPLQPPWATPWEPRSLGPPQAPPSRRVSAEPEPDPPEDADYSNEPSGYVAEPGVHQRPGGGSGERERRRRRLREPLRPLPRPRYLLADDGS